jgi:hypothetical protein
MIPTVHWGPDKVSAAFGVDCDSVPWGVGLELGHPTFGGSDDIEGAQQQTLLAHRVASGLAVASVDTM